MAKIYVQGKSKQNHNEDSYKQMYICHKNCNLRRNAQYDNFEIGRVMKEFRQSDPQHGCWWEVTPAKNFYRKLSSI